MVAVLTRRLVEHSHVRLDAVFIDLTSSACRLNHRRYHRGAWTVGARSSFAVRSIMRLAARTSSCRIAVVGSTSTMIAFFTSIRFGGVGKEGLSTMGTDPACDWMSRRDELGDDLGRGSKGRIVQDG